MPSWIQPFLSIVYWFGPYPAPFAGTAYWAVVGVAAGGFVLGLALKLVARIVHDASVRRVLERLGSLGVTCGVLVAISFFFTQTQTPLLGDRFWFLLWLVVAVVWLWFILRYAFWVAPKERAQRARQAEYEKYLPKRAD